MRSCGWVLIQYDWCPYKKGNLDTETCTKERRCEETQGEHDLLQAWGYQKRGERWRTDPSPSPSSPASPSASEGVWPFHWLWISGLQNCETINIYCSNSLTVVLCYGSPSKLISINAQVNSSIVYRVPQSTTQNPLNETTASVLTWPWGHQTSEPSSTEGPFLL